MFATVTSIAPVAPLQVAGVLDTSTAEGAVATTESECCAPAPSVVTTPSPPGGVDCPLLLSPQATTLPFERSASVWLCPAATATTPLRPAGTLVCWFVFWPQHATVPSDFSATV